MSSPETLENQKLNVNSERKWLVVFVLDNKAVCADR